jgi:hypothetical protein
VGCSKETLSPLLLCIGLIPLTEQLNRLNTGLEEHTAKTKLSHLLYMDDLKLISKSEELQKKIQRVTTFSDAIHMESGLDRCTKIIFKKGKLVYSQNLVVDINREIEGLEQGKTCRYLGTEEILKEYIRRLRMILKSELNAKNKITAIGALAVPVLRYTFVIITWRLEDIKKIGRKARRIITMYKI